MLECPIAVAPVQNLYFIQKFVYFGVCICAAVLGAEYLRIPDIVQIMFQTVFNTAHTLSYRYCQYMR